MRLTVLAALFVVACATPPVPSAAPTSATSASPTDAPTAQPTAPPTATLTAAPASPLRESPSPAAYVLLCAGEGEECDLAPGQYHTSRTIPTVVFTLQDGWSLVRNYADGFALARDEGVLQFGRDVTLGENGIPLRDAESLEAFLTSGPPLLVLGSQPTTLGVLSAVQVDVVAFGNAEALVSLDEDTYSLSHGQKARFIVVQLPERIGLFVVESVSEDTFDAAMHAVQPVLNSLRFIVDY